MTPRSGFLGALLIGGMLVVSMPESASGGGGPRPSERVEHLDGTGVSIFTILPDQSEWTIENFWPNNSVNGTVGFPDDTTTFINCAPTNRTIEETSLDCRIYDSGTGTWGDPLATTVDRSYLDGDFLNEYNRLFGVTGEYVLFAEAPGLNQAYRAQFLAARQVPSGPPVLIGQTNPDTDAAFLVRDTDLPGGATGTTNFTMGIQTGEFCLDFRGTPSTPGGALVGTLDVRTQNGDGSCGDPVVEGQSTALLPSGSAGRTCEYRVTSESDCGDVLADDTICLACVDSCIEFADPVVVQVENGAGYADCGAVTIELAEGATCSTDCDGVPALFFVTPPED